MASVGATGTSSCSTAAASGTAAIAAGTMLASVAQFPFEMGRAAVESAVKVMRGETLPAGIMVRLEMVTKASLSRP